MLPQDCAEFPTEICIDLKSDFGHELYLVFRHPHLVAVSKSFERSPKDRTYLASLIPDFNLASKRSHLFRNSTSSTVARSLLLHTAFQRRTLSSCSKGEE